jgi:predicted 3-demethylubiquinone-9 3-methyltransferase (glyoxalase superfamily)
MLALGTCLWFDTQAEEAAKFYVSIFPNSKITATSRYPDGPPDPKRAGQVLTVAFVLDGREFMGLNGGPLWPFTPAVSIVVHCDTQDEVDRIWARLADGGQEVQCGWVTDRYGLSWQVVPREFMRMIASPDKAAAQRAMSAMLPMKKLDLAVLRKAFENA